MIINFALSLSLAGIDLLQRTDSGWRRVGTASLLSADIAAELAALRAKGLALAPDGFYTKLVIPMEQVKYLRLDTAQTTLGDITAALDGATPYALDALTIDFERADGFTHIAAVAHETLREAADFAKAHGFNPVAFVAVPDPDTFTQEIFFGPTAMAASILGAGVTVTRDSVPVTLVGTRIKSHLMVLDEPQTPAAAVPRPAVPDTLPIEPAHLDRIIPEHHAAATQTEVPLIAVPAPGSTRPVVLGGVMETKPKAVTRWPVYGTTGAVAAGLAALGVVWLMQSGPAPVTAPATVVAEAAPDAALLDIAIAPPAQRPLTQTLPENDTALALSAPPQLLTLDTDDNVIAVQQPLAPPDATDGVSDADDVTADFAATSVWQGSPRLADLPRTGATDELIRPVSTDAPDRLAQPTLPATEAFVTDLAFLPLADPPAADATFDLDADGFVTATPDGALTPDGAIVFAGLPDLPFRARPLTEAETSETSTEATVADAEAAVPVITGPPPVVPPLRPATSADDTAVDSATAGGVSLADLQPGAATTQAIIDLAPPNGAIRPQARPALPAGANTASEVDAVLGGIALATPDPRATGSAFAVAASLRPTSRPANFDRVVAAVRSSQQPAAAPEPAPSAGAIAAAPAPEPRVQAAAPVAPQNYEPVPGGVARAATQDSVIRLREINLIGVFGQPSARRALVRMGNGQLIRVQVGSELDGGQVTAIGENALNYVKRGTTYGLQIPQG